MNRRLASLVALTVLSVSAIIADPSVFILDYHTFIGKANNGLDFSPAEFIKQLDRFEKLGFKWVSLDDAIAGKVEGYKNLVLTIDDGNHSVPAVVKDILKPRGIVPTLFVSAGLVLKEPFTIKPDTVKEMAGLGCIIGTHGYTHQYMTGKAFAANPDMVKKEISKPGPIISEMLGKPQIYFAYPYGVLATGKESLVAAAGYQFGFSANGNLVPINFQSAGYNRYDVPRTIVYKGNIEKIYSDLERYAVKMVGMDSAAMVIPQ
ncbi:MAG: polysaccharide deacetylase family protein [Treponemataceae bacterium]